MLNDDRVIIRSEVQHVLVLLSYVSYQTDFLTFFKETELERAINDYRISFTKFETVWTDFSAQNCDDNIPDTDRLVEFVIQPGWKSGVADSRSISIGCG